MSLKDDILKKYLIDIEKINMKLEEDLMGLGVCAFKSDNTKIEYVDPMSPENYHLFKNDIEDCLYITEETVKKIKGKPHTFVTTYIIKK